MKEPGKMAELNIEAPLAKFETEEWVDFTDYQMCQDVKNSNRESNDVKTIKESNDNIVLDNLSDDTFTETFSGSLEDLVNTFDEKITQCFCNYEEKVEKFAPVQVRSQDEIMNECQIWWTITGNFGNILPIDWSKSFARKFHMPALNLNDNQNNNIEGEIDLEEEDENLACDLDMHSLIISGLQHQEPLKTAEEVIKEIDDIMEETRSCDELDQVEEVDSIEKRAKQALASPLYEEKLETLSVSQLNELFMELELLIKEYSETLIHELALRDELEYEKELKNQFISLLLSVQNKRRQYNTEKKRKINKTPGSNGVDPKYLTTVIPYNVGEGTPDVSTLQVLIKILKAINEDSPTVPTLLTGYILRVLCPS